MTVELTDPVRVHLGDSVTTTFGTPYFHANTDLQVFYDAGDGSLLPLQLDEQFSVTGAKAASGGTITLIDSTYIPGLSGETQSRLVITTVTDANQGLALTAGGSLSATLLTHQLDRQARMIQEDRGAISRSVRAPLGDTAEMELPTVAERALRIPYFDADGNLQVVLPADVEDLETPSNANAQPFKTAADIGLRFDRTIDNGPLLQQAIDTMSAAGGGTIWVGDPNGGTLRLDGTIRVKSRVTLILAARHEVTAASRLTIAGQLAAIQDRDAFNLVSDAVVDGTTLAIDTTPHGGGPVSDFFAAGDLIEISGFLDSCGTATQQQMTYVDSVDATTITVADPLAYAYSADYTAGDYEGGWGTPNKSIVRLISAATVTSDVAEGTNLVPINAGDAGILEPGDWVLCYDRKINSDVAGTDTSPIHAEINRIVEPVAGDAAASVRLASRLEHALEDAYRPRLIKLDPAIGASIQGANVSFTEAPSSQRVHVYELRYAVGSHLIDCSLANDDNFGTRGNAFRVYRSALCSVVQPFAADAKYVDSGDGNGLVFAWSSDCWSEGGSFAGMRHSVQFLGATRCVAKTPRIVNPRHSPLDCHGAAERSCRVEAPDMVASTTYEPAGTKAPQGIVFGNPSLLSGPKSCGVEGGRLSGFKADSGSHEPNVQFFPGAEQCYVKGTTFVDCGVWIYHEDTAGQTTLVATGNRLEECTVDGCSDWLIDLAGRVNGASVNTLVDTLITGCTFRRLTKLVRATFASELELIGNSFDEITADVSFSYAIEAENCPRLRVVGNEIYGASRFARLTGCTDQDFSGNKLTRFENATILDDRGTNTGQWIDNSWLGTTLVPNRTLTVASVLIEHPRLIGIVIIPDDTAFTFSPLKSQGTITVYTSEDGTLFGKIMFRCDGNTITRIAYDGVEVSTGILTGTTGTDGNFTVSCHTNDQIYFENRTGSSVTIDASVE
jgi:hypothetical protein